MINPPKRLLTQNSELKKVGVWNWTIPAHVVTLTNGERMNCCPNAGSCGRVCYAKFGTYNFSNVKARHLQNLEYVLYDGDLWESQMLREVRHKRMTYTGKPHDLPVDPHDTWLRQWVELGGKAVRIHDAGDFYSPEYLMRWINIASKVPHVLFYAYTKEVAMVIEYQGTMPSNLRIVFSYGGRQDRLINRDKHRHADVFPTFQALQDAGYFDQSDNDLLAVTAPTNKIGIVANNLPVAIKRFDGRTMSALAPMRLNEDDVR
jgi:hypothetical protein